MISHQIQEKGRNLNTVDRRWTWYFHETIKSFMKLSNWYLIKQEPIQNLASLHPGAALLDNIQYSKIFRIQNYVSIWVYKVQKIKIFSSV